METKEVRLSTIHVIVLFHFYSFQIFFVVFQPVLAQRDPLRRLFFPIPIPPMAQAIVVGGGLAGVSAANTVLECGGKASRCRVSMKGRGALI